MSRPWKEICAGCKYINSQEPNQHCYMFHDAPSTECAQNTKTMSEAKQAGTVLTLRQVSELDPRDF